MAQRLTAADSATIIGRLGVWVSVFGDAGFASSDTYTLSGAFLGDAGVGVSLRGRLYDRDVTLRLDAPLFVQQPALSGGRGLTTSHADLALRWVFTLNDLW